MCMLDAQCTVGQAGQWCLLPTLVACMPMLYLGRRRNECHCCGEPQAWTKTVAKLKSEIVAGRKDADLLTPNLKIGVSTNFNKLVSWGQHDGCIYVHSVIVGSTWQQFC